MDTEKKPDLRENPDQGKQPGTRDRNESSVRVEDVSSGTERLALGQIEGVESPVPEERQNSDHDAANANTAIVVAKEIALATTISDDDRPVLFDAMEKVVNWSTVQGLSSFRAGKRCL